MGLHPHDQQGPRPAVKTHGMPWRNWILGNGFVKAGPFSARPRQHFGINMAKEIPGGDYRLDVPDFGVPDRDRMIAAVMLAVAAHNMGKDVYVGCMGGIGRTGTFLACFAKVMGHRDPVEYVRIMYDSRACETGAQVNFVRGFPARRVRWELYFKKCFGV